MTNAPRLDHRRPPQTWERLLATPFNRRRLLAGTGSIALAGVIAACTGDGDGGRGANGGGASSTAAATDGTSTAPSNTAGRPAGWTEASHGNDVEPNYEVVFPTDRVNQLTVRVTPEQWTAMLEDMTNLHGERGSGGGPSDRVEMPDGPGGEGGPFGPGEQGFPGGGAPPSGLVRPGGGPGGGENPMWVPATIEFDGLTWTNVGVRFKGNSSLSSAWSGGTDKLPLKFDFDEFEGDYPEIDNQRFYGFKQLSLSNNFGDDTQGLRETLAYAVLDEPGLVASRTAAYEVVLDRGEGPTSLGLYTVIEVTDDTVISRAFGSDEGNIYEGDGQGARLSEGTRDQISSSFQKENNEEVADWSDVERLYDVLHSSTRTTDPEAWRSEFERVFDVDEFLEWLGLGAGLEHWDTYGGMAHNFYLYHDPETDRLTWISWDHNLILGSGFGGGFREAPGGSGGGDAPVLPDGALTGPQLFDGGDGPGSPANTTLDRAGVGDDWPLIRFLLDDPVYYARYVDYLRQDAPLLTVAHWEATLRRQADLRAPFVEDRGALDGEVDALIEALQQQEDALATFLA